MSAPHLRIAKPASDLARTTDMYCRGLGLRVLGRFDDHEGFDGVMIGAPGAGYHFEFTRARQHPVRPAPTIEDLAVFYIPSEADWEAACARMLDAGFTQVPSFNPYWNVRGRTYVDLDGYRVVLERAEWREGQSPAVGSPFLEQCREYLIVDYRTKLRCAVEALPPDKLWWRPNDSSNSVGNLLLHLIGNVRQWIVSGIGGTTDTRNRPAEFDARQGASAAELLAELDRVLAEADRILGTVTPDLLVQRRLIQGRDITILDAILSVVQHFAQHLGQIIWTAKFHVPGSIQFVDDAGGLARPIWRAMIRPLPE